MKVSPLLTTASGFFRYKLNDLLLVDDFIGQTPSFTFLGRINEVDLVGEKISTLLAQSLLELMSKEFQIKAISLLAFQSPHPHYRMLVEGPLEADQREIMNRRLEELMLEHLHYKLARELNQLSSSGLQASEDAMGDYLRYSERGIVVRGNIKMEPLLMVRG